MAKIVPRGELMIRPRPNNYERFAQTGHLEFRFGGEANAAMSLCR